MTELELKLRPPAELGLFHHTLEGGKKTKAGEEEETEEGKAGDERREQMRKVREERMRGSLFF